MKDFLEILKKRRSIRKFSSQAIPQDIIEKIIDCARFAPTARNLQPWKFVVVRDRDTLIKLSEITSPNGTFIKDANVCIVVCCQDTKYYLEDGCSATVYILIASFCLGLGSCWIAGDKKPYVEEISSLLNIPQDYKIVSLVALGYPEEHADKEKKPLRQVLCWNNFK